MTKPSVIVYRGKNIEAEHHVSVAVVDQAGALTHYLGDPETPFMTRSSLKPFQLMPLILTRAAEHYGFNQKELAIMASSHNGADDQIEIVKSILIKAGNIPEMLQCGCIWPLGMMATNRHPRNDEHHDPLRHDCSGKHAGFLALAKFMGDDLKDYLNPDNKSQTLIRETVSEYMGLNLSVDDYGIDGCSAPNYPVNLRQLATAYVNLTNCLNKNKKYTKAEEIISQAMLMHPELISGENRLDFELSRLFPGRIISKIGMESIEGIGFIDPQIGIAVKIHDGHIRALGVVCVELFRKLGLLEKASRLEVVDKYISAKIYNDRKIEAGKIIADFELKKV